MSDGLLAKKSAAEAKAAPLPVLVNSISGAWRLRISEGSSTTTFSPPGHLLHYVVAGTYQIVIGNKRFEVTAGDVIYYSGVEEVRAVNSNDSVIFYSVSFQAPELIVNRAGSCVFGKMSELEIYFDQIYQELNSPEAASVGLLRSVSALYAVLAELAAHEQDGVVIQSSNTWLQAEQMIREHYDWRVSIPELCDQLGVSASTLHRSCKQALNLSPGKRILQLRLEEARGLLRYTDLSISEIADELSYASLHDFSRDASKYFGHSATEERQLGRQQNTS
ncbi:helix-turn-helix domain-containing protein [Persicirhabdus sediminis]|uniref:Helix-turn-helix domain-containing protein n=1 Tax=Persicirhabdus sediminis TaxID=454144 RepID=A0A8J7SP75_9BACT|nr:AraC family transcriptional regulator [Persicirhabdus sediminis]MBK1792153.1 helix-turn-helix domain-containing protein [Persicirhabdus sediminis]